MGYCYDSNAFLVRAKTATGKYIDSTVVNVKFLKSMNNIDQYFETLKPFKREDDIHNLKQFQQYFEPKEIEEQTQLPEPNLYSNDFPITDIDKLKEKYPEIMIAFQEKFNKFQDSNNIKNKNNPNWNQQSDGPLLGEGSGMPTDVKGRCGQPTSGNILTKNQQNPEDTLTTTNQTKLRCVNIDVNHEIRASDGSCQREKLRPTPPLAINDKTKERNMTINNVTNQSNLTKPIRSKFRSRYGNKYGSGIFDKNVETIKTELKNFKGTISYISLDDINKSFDNSSQSRNQNISNMTLSQRKRRHQTINETTYKKVKMNNNFQINVLTNQNIKEMNRIFPPPKRNINNIIGNVLDDYNSEINAVVENIDKNDANWKAARQREIEKLKENQVFITVKKTKGMKVIPTRFVYTYKNSNQKSEQFKARFVVKGYAQKEFINYDPTRISSPVADMTSIKLLTSIAVQKELKIFHVDVKLAYLNAPLFEKIYIQPPKDMDFPKNEVWQLQRALYGLKQSAHAWYNCIKQIFNDMNFKDCLSNPCIFTNNNTEDPIIIAIYVDDLFILTKNDNSYHKFYEKLSQKVELSQQGEISEYLGIEFKKTEYGYTLSQKKYVEEMLKKFTPENENIQKSIPCPIRGQKLLLNENYNDFDEENFSHYPHNRVPEIPDYFYHDEEDTEESISPSLDDEGRQLYQSAIGSLLWLTQNTRPEISYAVNALGTKNHNPSLQDYQFLVYLLAYIKKNPVMELIYEKDKVKFTNDFMIHGFLDASYAPQKSRHSITGNCIYVNGHLISWLTRKQRIITTSSKTCELYALGTTVNQASKLQELIEDLNEKTGMITIFEDNQAVIYNIYGRKMNCSRRSVDIIMKAMRQEVLDLKTLSIPYVKSKINIADLFTKALSKKPFTELTKALYNEGGLDKIEILNEVKKLKYKHVKLPIDDLNNITEKQALIINNNQDTQEYMNNQ